MQWELAPADGGFELRWREFGGPALPPDPKIGFGTAMIAGMIERQLRGQVERAWEDRALVITIKVPGPAEPQTS